MYCSYVSVGRWILPVLSTWCADSCVCVCVCHWLPLLLLLLLHGLQQRKEQPSADVIGYLVVLNISAHKTISTSQLLRWELNVGLMSIFSSSLISKFSVGLIIKSNAGPTIKIQRKSNNKIQRRSDIKIQCSSDIENLKRNLWYQSSGNHIYHLL